MRKVRLIALVSGNKKNGGMWYKATLKANKADGTPIVNDFFLSETAGKEAIKQNLIEDVDVELDFDFDDFLHICIAHIRKASTSSKPTTGV